MDAEDLLNVERMEVMMSWLLKKEENFSLTKPICSSIQSIDHVKEVVVIVEYKQ